MTSISFSCQIIWAPGSSTIATGGLECHELLLEIHSRLLSWTKLWQSNCKRQWGLTFIKGRKRSVLCRESWPLWRSKVTSRLMAHIFCIPHSSDIDEVWCRWSYQKPARFWLVSSTGLGNCFSVPVSWPSWLTGHTHLPSWLTTPWSPARSGTFILFLIFEEKLLAFHHEVWY